MLVSDLGTLFLQAQVFILKPFLSDFAHAPLRAESSRFLKRSRGKSPLLLCSFWLCLCLWSFLFLPILKVITTFITTSSGIKYTITTVLNISLSEQWPEYTDMPYWSLFYSNKQQQQKPQTQQKWLDSFTDSMDMCFSKLQETVKDREAWRAVVHGVTKSWTWLSNWTIEMVWLCLSERESESHSVVSDSLWPHGLYSPWNSPDQNTGVGSCSLLQGIFPTQGLNPGLPHCRWILYHLSHRYNRYFFPKAVEILWWGGVC